MRKSTQDIFLGARLLVSIYFILLGFFLENLIGNVLVFTSALYLGISVLMFFYPPRRGILVSLSDLTFPPLLVFLSGTPTAVYSLLPFVVLYVNRGFRYSLILLTFSIALSFYYMHDTPKELFPTLILLTTGLISGLAPDLTEALSKKRKSMLNLKNSYNLLMRDFSRWERERRELKIYEFLMDAALSSEGLEDFMSQVKDGFDVGKIYILPKKRVEDTEPSRDFENGALLVPVRLERGYAVVVFELKDPFQLKDELLVSFLIRAASMLSLFVEDFSEEYYTKFKVLKIV